MKKLLAALLFAVLCVGLAFAAAPDEEKYIVVDAEGVGSSREKAIEQAYMDAVRRSLGMFLDAKTEVKDNGISEKIISYSRGVVEKYEVTAVDDSQAARGRYAVKIRASVRRDQLRQGLEHAQSGGQTVEFAVEAPQPKLDPAALEKADTKAGIEARQAKAGPELMKALLDRYPPEKFLKLEIASKVSTVDAAKELYKVDAKVTFQTDAYYNSFLPELTKLLDQLSDSKKKEFYRGQQAIADLRAIRDGKPVRSPDGQSVFARYATNANNYDVIVPGKINTFSYTGYKLKESVKNGVLNVLSAYLVKTQNITGVMLRFLDESGEEINYQEQPVGMLYLTNGKLVYPAILSEPDGGIIGLAPALGVFLDRDVGRGKMIGPMVRPCVKGVNNPDAAVLDGSYLLQIEGVSINTRTELAPIFTMKSLKAGDKAKVWYEKQGKNQESIITLVPKTPYVVTTKTLQEQNSMTFPIRFEIPKEIFDLVKTLKIEFIMKQ